MTHVEGEVDPIRDFDIITEELRLKDEEGLLKNLEKLERACIRGNDKKLKPEYVSRKFQYYLIFSNHSSNKFLIYSIFFLHYNNRIVTFTLLS